MRSRRNGIFPYTTRSCLIDARILLFMVEQVFLSVGKVRLMHSVDTQCTVGGERRPKDRKIFFV